MTVISELNFNRDERTMWVLATIQFVLGDIWTTWLGLSRGYREANPVAREILGFGVGAMVLTKIILMLGAIGLFIGVPRVPYLPKESRIGIPIGLTLVGFVITTWNYDVVTSFLDPIRKLESLIKSFVHQFL